MSKENNKFQIDIENLFKQNTNDLSAIKELYRKLKEVEEKITQIKYIDNTLVKKLKKEYENLKKIILDENTQIEITNDIETINSQIETINSQMDNKANKQYVNEEIAKAQLEGAGVDTTNFAMKSDISDCVKTDELFGREAGLTNINLIDNLTFTTGSISSSTGVFTETPPSGYTIFACSDFFSSDDDISLVVPNGVIYRHYWYDKESKNYVSASGESSATRTLTNQYLYKVGVRLSNSITAESANVVRDNIKKYITLTTTKTVEATNAIITKEKLLNIGMSTKEDIESISSQLAKNVIGGTCGLQDKIGNYYKVNSISPSGNVKGILQNNQTKWHDTTLKIYVDGVAQTETNTVNNRGSITINVDNMDIKQSLGMWCFIPSKYIVENTTRDGIS